MTQPRRIPAPPAHPAHPTPRAGEQDVVLGALVPRTVERRSPRFILRRLQVAAPASLRSRIRDELRGVARS